jgi:hypothetical protein
LTFSTASNPEITLVTLPDDVLFHILSFFRTDGCRHHTLQDNCLERACLLALSRTCKRLNRMANEFLYRDIRVNRWYQEPLVVDFLQANPHIRKYVCYYRGCEPDFLGGLLGIPLHLKHLTIPASAMIFNSESLDDDVQSWMNYVHKDLIVEEIHFETFFQSDSEILSRMHIFNGLKTLCLSCIDPDGDGYLGHPSEILDHLVCPELEHLAIWHVDSVLPIAVNSLPKLQSLYLKLGDFHRALEEYDYGVEPKLYNNLMMLKDRHIYFFADQNDVNSGHDNGQWVICDYLFDEAMELLNVDPTPVIQWLVRSAFFFADFYGWSSDPNTGVVIDFRPLFSAKLLELALRAINTIDFSQVKPHSRMWLLIPLDSQCNHSIVSLMPTNVRILDIDFWGSEPIPSYVITEIISALPQLLELFISVMVDGPDTEHYSRFTDSSFTSLFPQSNTYTNLISHSTSIAFTPGQEPSTSIAQDMLEESKDFIAEVMSLFNLNSTLRVITVQVASHLQSDGPLLNLVEDMEALGDDSDDFENLSDTMDVDYQVDN